jgi:hypothetical protein
MPSEDCTTRAPGRTPWNKGKLIGAKPPLRPKHVWSIKTRLLVQGRFRDLAMFNLAIDSKLRGCDVVALKVEDVAPNGYAIDRAMVRQKKPKASFFSTSLVTPRDADTTGVGKLLKPCRDVHTFAQSDHHPRRSLHPG